MEKQWYVVWAKPGQEEHVANQLEHRALQPFFPKIRSSKAPWTGRLEPLFSCYLFCKLDIESEDLLIARSAHGVRGILGMDGRPTPLPHRVVRDIAESLKMENRPLLPRQFQPGKPVIIGLGPFRDMEAIFDRRLSASGRARVFIQMVGRLWSVQVDAAYLKEAV